MDDGRLLTLENGDERFFRSTPPRFMDCMGREAAYLRKRWLSEVRKQHVVRWDSLPGYARHASPDSLRPKPTDGGLTKTSSVSSHSSLSGTLNPSEVASRSPADLAIGGSSPQAILDTGGSYTLGIRDSLNAVMVYLPAATADLRSAFEQTYGGNVVLEERVIEPISCTINDCRYELRGGIKIQPAASTTAYCSSAFAAFSPNNYYLLSAAHCSGTQRYHAGVHFGHVTDEEQVGYVDAERLYRPVPSQWYVGAGIRIDGTDIRPIYSHITWANTALNTWIGKSGARTDTTRGYIIDRDISLDYVPASSRFVLAELCARKGDSGGSVFRNNTAYGIVSAGQEAVCNENSVMAFGNIVYALNAMQLQLLASP